MKNQIRVLFLALVLPMLLSTAHAQGTAFTYQGRLNNSGSAANGLYDFRFKLYFDPLGNTQAGSSYATNGIGVTNGLFLTTIDFGPALFNGSNYWLEVDVRTNGASTYTVLSPYQALLPVPYAVFANSASNLTGVLPAAQLSGMVNNGNLPASPTVSGTVTAGSFSGNGANVTNVNAATLNGLNAANFWQLGGNNVAPGQLLGSTNHQAVEIWAGAQRALRLEPNNTNYDPNVIAGSPLNYVTPGVEGATISGGGETNATAAYSNSVTANFGTIGGGMGNTASGPYATVSGGTINAAGSTYATVGGGSANSAINAWSTVAGGYRNSASGLGAFIGGGGDYASLFTYGNYASGQDSVIAGGAGNYATDDLTAVGGGAHNHSGSFGAAVGGGYANNASGVLAAVGGGQANYATNSNATIPGGYLNVAGGQYSFAAGQQAEALNDGTFVWADFSTNIPFASTAINQFLIRAQGGVGIGTTNPGAQLDVAGPSGTAIRVTGPAGFGSTVGYDLTTYYPGTNSPTARIVATDDGIYSASLDLMTKVPGAITNSSQSRLHINSSGNVGIGTNSPVGSLEVASATGWPQIQVDQLNPDYARVRLYALTNSIWDIAAQSELNFFNGSYGNVMTLEKNGRVGISSVPSTYLQVVNATCNGSSWINASDRNLKQDFAPVDAAAVLAKVVALPVQSWDYKAQPNDKHIGPVAQDFHAAFGLNGSDDKHIATVDEGGVALAAIQGLNQKLNEKDTEIAELKKRLGDLEQAIQTLTSKK